jgi:thioesterase domain-containing protein
MEAYTMTPYPGRVALIRVVDGPWQWSFMTNTLGWEQVALGGVTLDTIEGSHMSIIREPHVQGLAAALQAHLDASGS